MVNGTLELLPAVRSKLEIDLKPLNSLAGGLGARAIKYVISGTDEEVLTELRMRPRGGFVLGLQSVGARKRERSELMRALARVDAGIRLRLARVYAASAAQEANRPLAEWGEEAPEWLNRVLWEASEFEPGGPAFKVLWPFQALEEMLALDGQSPAVLIRGVLLGGELPSASKQRQAPRTSLVIPGFAEALQRFPEAAQAVLAGLPPAKRARARESLARSGVSLEPLKGAPAKRGRASEKPASEEPVSEALPPLVLPPRRPLTAEQRAALRSLCDTWFESALAGSDRSGVMDRGLRPQQLRPWGDVEFDRLVHFLEAEVLSSSEFDESGWAVSAFGSAAVSQHLERFWLRDDLDVVQRVRFLGLCGLLWRDERGMLEKPWSVLPLLAESRARTSPSFGLREVAAAMAGLGLPPRTLALGLLFDERSSSEPWEPEATWPYFAEHLDLLLQALETRAGSGRNPRAKALRVLESFPQPPAEARGVLWSLAFGAPSPERDSARRCLRTLPDFEARLLERLTDGRQDIRVGAADWVVVLGLPGAAPALRAALRKEKSSDARVAQSAALKRLGQPLVEGVGREGLSAEVEAGLKQGLPKALGWFPFDRLPAVHWRDDGQQVPPLVIQWWLVQHWKSDTLEPDPLLRQHAALLRPREAQELGLFLLEAWMARSTPPLTARHQRLLRTGGPGEFPEEWGEPGEAPSTDAFAALHVKARRPEVENRGLLAMAGPLAGPLAIPPTARFLRVWGEHRPRHGRELLHLLARLEHPAATQFFLSVATSSWSEELRAEAESLLQREAGQRGITVADLAFRAVPPVGLRSDGTLQLEEVHPPPTAWLTEELSLKLLDAEGRELETLMAPSSEEVPPGLAEARRRLSEARGEVGRLARQQKVRLHEAMCGQYAWPFPVWRELYGMHPVLRRLATRCVWVAQVAGRQVATFRPRPDGSLRDALGESVSFPEEATVLLAHSVTLDPATQDAWRTHLREQAVSTFLPQLEHSPYPLSEAERSAQELKGPEVEMKSLTLHERATALGYIPGERDAPSYITDGEDFEYSSYLKRFPTLGVVAEVYFRPPVDPRQGWPRVDVKRLSFSARGRGSIPLQDVPPVLLAECWHELREMTGG